MRQRAVPDPMPPVEHLAGLRPAGPLRPRPSARPARSSLRCPAADAPNRAGGASWGTRCRHSSDPSPTTPRTAPPGAPAPPCALRDRRTTKTVTHCGHRRPQPGPLLAFAPPGFVRVRRRLGLHIGPRLGHWLGHRLSGRLLQVGDGPQPQRHPKERFQQVLGRALREVIGPRAQRRRRLERGGQSRRSGPPGATLPAWLRHRPDRPTDAADTR